MTTSWIDAPNKAKQAVLSGREKLFAKKIASGEYDAKWHYDIHFGEMTDFIGRADPNSDALRRFMEWRSGILTEQHLDAESRFFWNDGDGETRFNKFDIMYRFTEGIRENEFTGAFIKAVPLAETFRGLEAQMQGYSRLATSRYGAGEYGAPQLSFRLLYEILCNSYNGGDYFVDTYLTENFPRSAVYREFLNVKNGIVREMAKELHETAMRMHGSRARLKRGNRFLSAFDADREDVMDNYSRLFGSWGDFSVWQNSHYRDRLEMVGRRIREDVIKDLSTGSIRLNHMNTNETRQKRMEAGLPPDPEFFASGQLINNLEIYIDLDSMMQKLPVKPVTPSQPKQEDFASRWMAAGDREEAKGHKEQLAPGTFFKFAKPLGSAASPVFTPKEDEYEIY